MFLNEKAKNASLRKYFNKMKIPARPYIKLNSSCIIKIHLQVEHIYC